MCPSGNWFARSKPAPLPDRRQKKQQQQLQNERFAEWSAAAEMPLFARVSWGLVTVFGGAPILQQSLRS
jgi:hypothetical protein